jgi:hypothetical protein
MFDLLVFTDPEESMGHLAPLRRGLLGPPSAQRLREVRDILAQTFSRPPGQGLDRGGVPESLEVPGGQLDGGVARGAIRVVLQ